MNKISILQIKLRPIMRPIIRFFLFFYYDTHFIIGNGGKLKVSLANTIFNLSSGNITINDYAFFGHNVMVLTGKHIYRSGKRAGLDLIINSKCWGGGEIEVPNSGYDIIIGSGTWIASGAIILGNVTIGNNVIVAASSLVNKDVPDFAIIAGIPAKIIGDTRNL